MKIASHRLVVPAFVSIVAACGGGPLGGDDLPDAGELARDGLDRCADDGVRLELVWSVDNLHDAIVSMAVAPDGTVVLGTADGVVKQWDVGVDAGDAPRDDGRPGYGSPLSDEPGPAVRALAIGTGGDVVVGGDDDGGLRRWHVPGADLIGAVPLDSGSVTAVAAASAGQVVVADDRFGGGIRVVDLATGGTGSVFQTALWGVTTLAVQGDALYTAGHDYGLAAVERRVLAAPVDPVDTWDAFVVDPASRYGWTHAVAVTRDGAWVAAAGERFVVILAADDLAAGPVTELALDDGAHAIAFTPSGRHVAFATPAGVSLRTRDLAVEVAAAELPGVTAVALDPSGDRLLVGAADGRLRAYACR
jgi:WD40 repeat protein